MIHWDGSACSAVAGPKAGAHASFLTAATASGDSVCAVDYSDRNGSSRRPRLTTSMGSSFDSISATGPGDAWAVGGQILAGQPSNMIEHWNGTSWTVVPSPQFELSVLMGVAAISPNDAWAVGTYNASTNAA